MRTVTFVHRQVAWWASRTPEAIAILTGDRSLSYAQVRTRARAVARSLRRHGAAPDALVAIASSRTPDAVIAMLGVLEAGAAYVPLDMSYPAARLRATLVDARPAMVLAEQALAPEIVPPGVRVLPLDGGAASGGAEVPEAPLDPDNLAYAVYTSGSTGRPNGVLITHAGLSNVIDGATTLYGIAAGGRLLQAASFGFDASVLEIFLALSNGATLVMCDDFERLSGPELQACLQRHEVTWVTLTPLMLAALDPAALPRLAVVAVGGDTCLPELPRRWAPGRRLVNAYGPTEASIFVSAYACTGDELSPPIGKALPGTRMLVLDEAMEPAPTGVPGEIYIGGTGLARGYLQQPALTAERFVPDPFGAPGDRLYRTGDLGRRRADGHVEFLGRIDRQVKVRGVRIELSEVELALRRHPAFTRAIARIRHRDGAAELVVYYVPPPGAGRPTLGETRTFLRQYLPASMCPTQIVALDRFPATANGKLDERALPDPWESRPVADTAQVTDAQQRVAAIWAEVLGRSEPLAPDDSFFDLGGHSLMAARLAQVLRDRLGVHVPLRLVFEHPTVADMTAALSKLADAASTGEAV